MTQETSSLQIAGRTLMQEARGEPLVGQQAVAHVLWNRMRSGRWGPNLMSVCLYRSQFSAWGPVNPSSPQMVQDFFASCALADADPELQKMIAIVVAAETADDPTKGSQFYYASTIKEPDWAKTMIPCGTFGSQRFFKEK
jgi:spore germination cell wall hydrolase CwlJ-like protein